MSSESTENRGIFQNFADSSGTAHRSIQAGKSSRALLAESSYSELDVAFSMHFAAGLFGNFPGSGKTVVRIQRKAAQIQAFSPQGTLDLARP